MEIKTIYTFNTEKNVWLKQMRKISFEKIIEAIEQGFLLGVRPHPDQERYAHQEMYIVEIEGYAYIVPFVQEGNVIFLKTIYPSRKANKKYLK